MHPLQTRQVVKKHERLGCSDTGSGLGAGSSSGKLLRAWVGSRMTRNIVYYTRTCTRGHDRTAAPIYYFFPCPLQSKPLPSNQSPNREKTLARSRTAEHSLAFALALARDRPWRRGRRRRGRGRRWRLRRPIGPHHRRPEVPQI
jgi:hypothetical protein